MGESPSRNVGSRNWGIPELGDPLAGTVDCASSTNIETPKLLHRPRRLLSFDQHVSSAHAKRPFSGEAENGILPGASGIFIIRGALWEAESGILPGASGIFIIRHRSASVEIPIGKRRFARFTEIIRSSKMDDSDTETDVFCRLLTTQFLRFGGTPQAKRPVLSARMCPTGPYLASGGLDMAHFGLERFRQSNHAPSTKFQSRFSKQHIRCP